MPSPLDVADRCGRLAAWGSAALHGTTDRDTAASAIVGEDEGHDVVDLPGVFGPQQWGSALDLLDQLGPSMLTFVACVPGDVLGLPGPAGFNAAAANAGGAVIVHGPSLGLLPTVTTHGDDGDLAVTVRWTCWPVTGQPGAPWSSLTDADRQLTEQLQQAAADLQRLDTAAFHPDALGLLRTPAADASPLPPGWPDRAHRLLSRSQGVLAVIDLARRDDGRSVTAADAVQRDSILRDLHRAARQARAAAWNAGVAPLVQRSR
jgi:hypothetical protein